jgi:hypothetical protein
MVVRERLGPEEQARFDFQYLGVNTAAKELAERHGELSLIPIGQPDAIPKKIWRQKKTHGKANAPGLTAAQSSDRDQLEAERIANKGKARAATPEKEVERVPDSPRTPFYTSQPKEDECSSREDSWQANSWPRTTSAATHARTVPTSSPTSVYSTSYTIQREGRKGAQEDEKMG